MKKNIKYSLGLDIGIASIGWGIINLDEENNLTHIVDTGVVVVESMEDKSGNLQNAARRDSRGMRRTIRRRQYRVNLIKKELENYFNIENINNIYFNKNNVYEIKVKGLSNKLTKEELSVALIHYAKHRGFKSNRKEDTSGEEGAVLKAIESNKERKGDLYISELILSELNGIDKVKNSEDYKYSFLRADYQSEIEKLLDVQIKNQVITEKFKERYLEIWGSQRDFSEGPGMAQDDQNSYKVDYSSVFGYCTFYPEELRAPKFSITQQENTALSKLNNLSYKIDDNNEWKELTPEQISLILEESFNKKEMKYTHIAKLIDKKANVKFKSLKLSKSDYIKAINEYKDKENIDTVDTINDANFQSYLLKKTNDKVVFKMDVNHLLKSIFKKENMLDQYESLPREFKDDIAKCLTFYKTDERINNYFKGIETERKQKTTELEWELYPEIVEKIIPKIPTKDFKESASLSLKLLYKLNPLMKKGMKYDKAMDDLGFSHSQRNRVQTEKRLKLGQLKYILDEQFKNEISNPRVIRVLTKLVSLIDSCVDAYGSPYFINIEVARDINLKRGKRAILENEQLENLSSNESLKAQILNDNPNMTYNRITKYDIEKYKLYHEQNGICMYSLEPIAMGDLLTQEYEVDHIIPYSKSHNNTIDNKCLVKKSENQNKTDMVPLEYFSKYHPSKIESFKQIVNNNNNFRDKKKEYYLLKNLNEAPQEMKDGYIEGTRFITKYIIEILNNNLILKDEDNEDKERIVSHKAGYVNYFKRAMKINNLTHSLENPNYYRKTILRIEDFKIIKDGLEMVVINEIDNSTYTGTINIKKENKNTPKYVMDLNKDIQIILDNPEFINIDLIKGQYLFKNKNINVDVFDGIQINQNINREQQELLIRVLTILKSEITKQTIKKNRDNHLHHALDALATAGLTRSTRLKIAEYEKKKYSLLECLKKGPRVIQYANQEVIVKSVDEFQETENKYMEFLFPKPFPNFKKEIEAFVYERDEEEQRRILEDSNFRNIRVLMPVQTKKKRYSIEKNKITTRMLHKETILGKKGEELVKRINVKDLDKKKIEKIYDKDNSAKATYDACKYWLNNKDTEYPILNNGREIKKVKINSGSVEKALKIKRGYAEVDLMVRIDVYKKEGDNKFYFLGHNSLSLIQDYQGKEIQQKLWYGQGNKNCMLTNYQIKDNYQKVCELHPGDLIDIKLTKERQALCYVVGFTSGQLEVSSPLGDNYDLEQGIKTNRNRSQIFITISTIESIQKKKINIRGEIKN